MQICYNIFDSVSDAPTIRDMSMANHPSLRTMVLAATGQDVRQCCNCALCADIVSDDQDVPLEMLVQWVIVSDERALTCRTLWSDESLKQARRACANNLDIQAVILALRGEAWRRGIRLDGDTHGE